MKKLSLQKMNYIIVLAAVRRLEEVAESRIRTLSIIYLMIIDAADVIFALIIIVV